MRTAKVFYHLLCLGMVLALAAGVVHAQSITVTAPAAGVTWCKGQTYNITWTSSDEVPDQVRIRLRDSASKTVILNITDAAINSGVYSWTIPMTVAPGNYVMRVRSQPADIWGDSGVFAIADCTPAAAIHVTAPAAVPAGGQTWKVGQTYNITWTSSGAVPDKVNLRLRDSTSTTVIQKIADNIPTGAGSYSWTIPNTVEPGNYVVRVRAGEVIGDSVVFSIDKFALARIEKMPTFPKSFQLKVCVTNGKYAPIHGDRDIHVWIKNIGNFNSPSTTLKFFIGGKGTTTHVVPELIPGGEFKQTRRHSWSTSGKRTITAEVLVPGGEPIRVNGFISIHTWKPQYQLEYNVICSDGSQMKEADIFKDDPKPKDDPLLLTVCASDGKNPVINAKRDIHVWVRNPPHSGIIYRNLLLEFHVEGKPTTNHHIESLAPGGKIQFTRNHSWGKATNKKIRATVFSPGRTHQVSVESSFKVSHPGRPTSSAELNVKCSDGSKKKESDF